MRAHIHVCAIVAVLSSCLTAAPAENRPSSTQQSDEPQQFRNVELTATGSLRVQVVDLGGVGLSHVRVLVRTSQQKTVGTTDHNGRFAVSGLNTGMCVFQIKAQTFACRVWQHGTAPPKSIRSLALVNEDLSVVRGNHACRQNQCPEECCPECERTRCLSTNAKYGLGILALGGAAGYMALSRDNVSY